MDVNSGSVHIVDDVVYDVLPYLEKKESKEEILKALANSYAPAEIEEALEDVMNWKKPGHCLPKISMKMQSTHLKTVRLL